MKCFYVLRIENDEPLLFLVGTVLCTGFLK